MVAPGNHIYMPWCSSAWAALAPTSVLDDTAAELKIPSIGFKVKEWLLSVLGKNSHPRSEEAGFPGGRCPDFQTSSL